MVRLNLWRAHLAVVVCVLRATTPAPTPAPTLDTDTTARAIERSLAASDYSTYGSTGQCEDKVSDATTCASAASDLGYTYQSAGANGSSYPDGCIVVSSSGYVYYNSNGDDDCDVYSGIQCVCLGSNPTSAPSPPPTPAPTLLDYQIQSWGATCKAAISSAGGCSSAASALGLTYQAAHSLGLGYPDGCFILHNYNVYYNYNGADDCTIDNMACICRESVPSPTPAPTSPAAETLANGEATSCASAGLQLSATITDSLGWVDFLGAYYDGDNNEWTWTNPGICAQLGADFSITNQVSMLSTGTKVRANSYVSAPRPPRPHL